jgi:high affinity sulfate transporter 1
MIPAQKTANKPNVFQRFMPILYWLPGYQRTWLRPDLIAGLTVVALLIPEGMAYAELAGMPPEAAFLAAPIGLLLYAVFGSSRQLVVAVSSAVAVMSASIVSGFAVQGSAEFIAITSALAIMVGIVAIIFGLLRLGVIARFFSESIMTGFIFGLALVIVMKQLPKLFGIEAIDGNFWQRIFDLAQNLSETHVLTLVVGASSLLLMLLIERYLERVPAALIVLFYGILVSAIFGLDAKGVHVVGEIPRTFPIPAWPDISFRQWLLLIPGAVGITLVAFAEAVGPARDFAAKYKYSINENQELVGLGTANFGAGFFQGFSIGSSLSKSAANDAAGAKTQMSSIVAAGITLLVGLFLTWMFAPLPEATLAAIVIVAISGMFKMPEMRRLYRLNRTEFWLAMITFFGVLTYHEALVALLLGVVLALGVLVYRTSQTRLSILGREPGRMAFSSVEQHPQNQTWPELMFVRPDQELFFANVAAIRQDIRELVQSDEEPVQWLVLDLEMTSHLDTDTLDALSGLNQELLELEVNLFIANAHADVRALLERSGVFEEIGADRIFSGSIVDVLEKYVLESKLLSGLGREISEEYIQHILRLVAVVKSQAYEVDNARLEKLEDHLRQSLHILRETDPGENLEMK